MKKVFLTFLLGGLVFWTGFCLAEEIDPSKIDPIKGVAERAGYSTAVTDTSLSETVGGIIKAILGMIGVIFFALTFYAGYLWLTASGNDEKIVKAKGILTAAVIGLVIIFLSYGLTSLVLLYTMSASAPVTTVGG